MFFFLLQPELAYNLILIPAAVIPAVVLMILVAKSDKLERESPRLLFSLVLFGFLAAAAALVQEKLLSFILDFAVPATSPAYNVILYFLIVAGAEEGAKFLFLNVRTWRNPQFNCQFDGVVYATFLSLGFALLENVGYVVLNDNGLATALVRAVTAIPGHACFGVFMGIFYGVAKRYDYEGKRGKKSLFLFLAFAVPMLLHGTYDYLTTLSNQVYSWIFVGFVVVLFIVSIILVRRMSKRDRYIDGTTDTTFALRGNSADVDAGNAHTDVFGADSTHTERPQPHHTDRPDSKDIFGE